MLKKRILDLISFHFLSHSETNGLVDTNRQKNIQLIKHYNIQLLI